MTTYRTPTGSRRAAAGAALLSALVALLTTGCGIRPTTLPVDAGGPASRTACPSPVQVPAAAATPSAPPTATKAPGGKSAAAQAPAVTAAPKPSAQAVTTPAAASPTPTAPPDGLFSALPSPSAAGTGRAGCP
ncbi:hypothetical protein [Kitasatospora sp. NPDC057223]|uniref:hypothetical protein n=1 Tax=Kitasatospora sp. NPDC057223 TaxID=3346055 RepID=UPI0036451CF3